MTYKLFLDDYRTPDQVIWLRLPPGPYLVVKNYQEFVDAVTLRGVPEFVTYDHDLADWHYHGERMDEYTGATCAKWLLDYCVMHDVPHPPYMVHSMNPVGARRIKQVLGD